MMVDAVWEALTKDQRAAAEALGYNVKRWNTEDNACAGGRRYLSGNVGCLQDRVSTDADETWHTVAYLKFRAAQDENPTLSFWNFLRLHGCMGYDTYCGTWQEVELENQGYVNYWCNCGLTTQQTGGETQYTQ